MLAVVGTHARVGYHGDGEGAICFEDGATLRFTCDEHGVGQIGETGSDALQSTLRIASAGTSLEIDLSQLRLPAGEHRFVLAKVDRLQGRFAREQIRGADEASIREAKVEYDGEFGEMRLLVVVSR